MGLQMRIIMGRSLVLRVDFGLGFKFGFRDGFKLGFRKGLGFRLSSMMGKRSRFLGGLQPERCLLLWFLLQDLLLLWLLWAFGFACRQIKEKLDE